MIPILCESTETLFTSNGIGALPDCLSCLVTEERNGQYEVEFTYPITGARYAEILEGRIICVTHDEQLDKQPFIIYRRSAPMDGIVTFNAHHYSYLLSGIAVSPFTASSVADAFQKIGANSMITNPFTFWTDNTTAGSMDIDIPMSARQVLGGVRGSILDVFGGEYEFDGLTVKNYAHRGANNGVTIRYGKNLTDLQQTIDAEFLPNAAVPYWKGSDDTVVYGAVTAATGQTATRVTVMDLSQDFDEQPSAAQLQTAARAKLDASQPWLPSQNISVDFVALWQTEEFKDIAPLERVQLCDTVTIEYPELGVSATAKVIKVVWDALLDRYDSIELGEAQSSFADTILSETDARLTEIDETIRTLPTTSMMETAIDHATELITGGLGGYVIINTDADGHPTEILIMDTPSTATAVNVWRFNSGGLGHSHSGYNGPYNDVALTADGKINASMITTGALLANMIYGGTLTLGGNNNGNGVMVINNAAGTEIGRIDNTGAKFIGELTTRLLNYSSYSQRTDAYAGFAHDVPVYNHADSIAYVCFTKVDGIRVLDTSPEYTEAGYSITTYRTGNTSDYLTKFTIVPRAYGASGTILEFRRSESSTSAERPKIRHIREGHEIADFHVDTKFSFEMYELGVSSGTNDTFFLVDKSCFYWGHKNNDVNGNTYDPGLSTLTGESDLQKPLIRVTSDMIVLGLLTNGGNCGTPGIYITASNAKINGQNVAFQGSSSKRYKHDITEEISEELNPHKLYELPMKQFVFNSDHKTEFEGMDGATLPGFIAEDVESIYPAATIYKNGEVENWDERRIIPGMLKLIQEQHEEIESLKDRVDRLEKLIERMEAKL